MSAFNRFAVTLAMLVVAAAPALAAVASSEPQGTVLTAMGKSWCC